MNRTRSSSLELGGQNVRINHGLFALFEIVFNNPLMLWGLVAMVVPIAIHLLMRARVKRVDWGAMRFLQRALLRQKRQLRLRTWLQLLARMGMIAALVLAAARPSVPSAEGRVDVHEQVQHLFLLDASLSSRAIDNEDHLRTFDRGREYILNTVRSAQAGDSFQIWLHGPEQPLIQRPTTDAIQTELALSKLEPSRERGDLVNSLNELQFLISKNDLSPENDVTPQLIVHVLTDMQRSQWEKNPTAVESALKKLEEQADLEIVNIGAKARENLAIVEVQRTPKVLQPWDPLSLSVRVQNFGQRRAQTRIELMIDGFTRSTESISLNGRESKTVSMMASISNIGWHGIELQLTDDALNDDNQFFTAVRVIDHLNVLLVDGTPASSALSRPCDFVELAFNHPGSGVPFWQVHRIDDVDFVNTDLSEFELIFLCDISRYSNHEATRILEFLQRGGGVVMSLGPATNRDNLNRLFGPSGNRLLPAELESATEANALDPLKLTVSDPVQPIVLPLAELPETFFSGARIYQFFSLTTSEDTPQNSRWNSVLETQHGDAIILLSNLEQDRSLSQSKAVQQSLVSQQDQFGNGRLALITTSLDEQWGSWVAWPGFLPLIHELSFEMVGEQLTAHDVRSPKRDGTMNADQQWIGPLQRLNAEALRGQPMVDDISDPGLYVSADSEDPLANMTVKNIDDQDSDLTVKSASSSTEFTGPADAIAFTSSSVTSEVDDPPFAFWLLLMAILFLVTDRILAKNVPLGVSLFCGVICASIARWIATTSPVVTICIGILVLVMGLIAMRSLVAPIAANKQSVSK